MDLLKKILPISFKASDKDGLIKALIIYIAAIVIMAFIGILLGWLPLIGILLAAIGFVVEFYSICGIIVAILVFTKVIKD